MGGTDVHGEGRKGRKSVASEDLVQQIDQIVLRDRGLRLMNFLFS